MACDYNLIKVILAKVQMLILNPLKDMFRLTTWRLRCASGRLSVAEIAVALNAFQIGSSNHWLQTSSPKTQWLDSNQLLSEATYRVFLTGTYFFGC